MYSFIAIVLIGAASYGIVGWATGNWVLAGYILWSVIGFGIALFLYQNRTALAKMKDTAKLRQKKRTVEVRNEKLIAEDLRLFQQKAKELERVQSELVFLLSHELRTPIASVRNFASLMLEGAYGPLPKAAEEGMQEILARTTDMAQSVDAYLTDAEVKQKEPKKSGPSIRSLKIRIKSEA